MPTPITDPNDPRVKSVLKKIEGKKVRMTPYRKALMNNLINTGGLGIEKIIKRMNRFTGKKTSLKTVQKNLRELRFYKYIKKNQMGNYVPTIKAHELHDLGRFKKGKWNPPKLKLKGTNPEIFTHSPEGLKRFGFKGKRKFGIDYYYFDKLFYSKTEAQQHAKKLRENKDYPWFARVVYSKKLDRHLVYRQQVPMPKRPDPIVEEKRKILEAYKRSGMVEQDKKTGFWFLKKEYGKMY